MACTIGKALLFPSQVEAVGRHRQRPLHRGLVGRPPNPFKRVCSPGRPARRSPTPSPPTPAMQWTQAAPALRRLRGRGRRAHAHHGRRGHGKRSWRAVTSTNLDTMCGNVNWKAGEARTPCRTSPRRRSVGGQWLTGEKYPFELSVAQQLHGAGRPGRSGDGPIQVLSQGVRPPCPASPRLCDRGLSSGAVSGRDGLLEDDRPPASPSAASGSIDDLGVKVNEGEGAGHRRANGAGKTTLFTLISGGVSARTRVGVTFKDRDIHGLSRQDRARAGVGAPSRSPMPFGDMSVFENVLVGAAYARGASERDSYERCVETLEIHAPASQGQRARRLSAVARPQAAGELARALAGDPACCCSTSRRRPHRERGREVIETVKGLLAHGITFIWIEHHSWRALLAVAARIRRSISFGRKPHRGRPHEVM